MSPLRFQRHLVCEERAVPADDPLDHLSQPFARRRGSEDNLVTQLTRDYGRWPEMMSPEATAYALGRMTAASILPPLITLESGSELLHYRVWLRDYLSDDLVWGLAAALEMPDPAFYWQRVELNGYACVIGAGVAAHLDITPGFETLTLRYANALVPVILCARRAADLPRSLLFLQAALYERFDALLERMRSNAWFWLAGG